MHRTVIGNATVVNDEHDGGFSATLVIEDNCGLDVAPMGQKARGSLVGDREIFPLIMLAGRLCEDLRGLSSVDRQLITAA